MMFYIPLSLILPSSPSSFPPSAPPLLSPSFLSQAAGGRDDASWQSIELKSHPGSFKSPSGSHKSPTGSFRSPSVSHKSPVGSFRSPSGSYKSSRGSSPSSTLNSKPIHLRIRTGEEEEDDEEDEVDEEVEEKEEVVARGSARVGARARSHTDSRGTASNKSPVGIASSRSSSRVGGDHGSHDLMRSNSLNTGSGKMHGSSSGAGASSGSQQQGVGVAATGGAWWVNAALALLSPRSQPSAVQHWGVDSKDLSRGVPESNLGVVSEDVGEEEEGDTGEAAVDAQSGGGAKKQEPRTPLVVSTPTSWLGGGKRRSIAACWPLIGHLGLEL